MIFGEDGVKPDPSKVEALEHITAPQSKEELRLHSQLRKKSAPLRELTKAQLHFKWKDVALKIFKNDTSLRYIDMSKPIYIFTDAHVAELGAMLGQG